MDCAHQKERLRAGECLHDHRVLCMPWHGMEWRKRKTHVSLIPLLSVDSFQQRVPPKISSTQCKQGVFTCSRKELAPPVMGNVLSYHSLSLLPGMVVRVNFQTRISDAADLCHRHLIRPLSLSNLQFRHLDREYQAARLFAPDHLYHMWSPASAHTPCTSILGLCPEIRIASLPGISTRGTVQRTECLRESTSPC